MINFEAVKERLEEVNITNETEIKEWITENFKDVKQVTIEGLTDLIVMDFEECYGEVIDREYYVSNKYLGVKYDFTDVDIALTFPVQNQCESHFMRVFNSEKDYRLHTFVIDDYVIPVQIEVQ